jgi:signal peptidase I
MTLLGRASRNAHSLKCELAGEVLRSAGSLRLRVTGWSMLPTVWPGDTLVVERAAAGDVVDGDIVLFSNGRRLVAHRLVARNGEAGVSTIQTQGDALPHLDSPVPGENLLGKVSFILRNGRRISPGKDLRLSERAIAALFRRSPRAARVVVGVHGLCQTTHGPSQVHIP